MENVQKVLSDDEFYQELIRRFFHPNSYFYHCISHHLDRIIQSNENSNNENYLLFGSFLDSLVTSENKVQELLRLTAIGGFHKFIENLTTGVSYLRDSDLTPEQMKIEIESLAQSMVKIALDALQHQDTREKLKEYLEYTKSDLVDTSTNEVNDSNSKLDDEEIIEFTEPPSEVPGNAEPELTQRSPTDLTEFNKNEEKDFLQFMVKGKDTSIENGIDSDLAKEGGSVDINLNSQNYTIGRDQVDEQPESVIRVFLTEIEYQLEQLQNTFKLLRSDIRNKNHWTELRNIFENIKSTAMIYGLEGFEQIAAKAIKIISDSIHEPENSHRTSLTLLMETKNVLSHLIQGDVENLDDKIILNLIQKLKNPKESLCEDIKESQQSYLTELEQSNFSVENKEKSIKKNQLNNNSDFILPGEDDEEIISLVREISKNNQKEDISESKTTDFGDSQPLISINKTEKQELKNEKSEPLAPKIVEPSFDDQLIAFKEEADLYFSIIEEALNTLETQADNKTALDDLELASYSLYGLTLKLNLEPLGKIPASIEGLIKNIISKKSLLSDKERILIKKAYQHFRSLTRIEETEKRQYKELLSSLQALNSRHQMNSYNDNPIPPSSDESKKIITETAEKC
ncbi:MAG: hypothetical protein ACE5JB_06935 [bacterium]